MKTKITYFIIFSIYCSHSISAIFVDIGWEKQIDESEYIVKGEVIKITVENYDYILNAYRFADGKKVPITINKTSPHTFYEVEIEEVLMGELKKGILTVIEYGGCIDDVCENSSSSFKFDLNERALMFLKRGDDGYYYARNGSYDMFSVSENDQIKRKASSLTPSHLQTLSGFNKSDKKVINNIDSLRALVKEFESEKSYNESDNSLLLDLDWHDENYVPYDDEEEQRLIDSHSISGEFAKINKKYYQKLFRNPAII